MITFLTSIPYTPPQVRLYSRLERGEDNGSVRLLRADDPEVDVLLTTDDERDVRQRATLDLRPQVHAYNAKR